MTLGDFLDMEAEKRGIPRALARAMAHQESRGRQSATSPKGARGIMQLMPGTAAGLNVNPDDPFENIMGGLDYFKTQLDTHKGDVRLALAAYNAGPRRTAAGRVPQIAETEEYVQRILAQWQSGGPLAPEAQPGAPAGATAPPLAASTGMLPQSTVEGDPAGVRPGGLLPGAGPGMVQTAAISLAKPYDPTTFEGRVNLAGTAAGVGAGLLTRNPVIGTAARASVTAAAQTAVRTGIAPWIIRVLGPPVAAGAAGALEAQTELMLNSAPAGTSPAMEGTLQASNELIGQGLMWPLRRVGASFVASRVGRQASEALADIKTDTRAMGADALTTVRERVKQATEAVSLLTKAKTAAAAARAASGATAAGQAAGTAGASRTAAAIAALVKQETVTNARLANVDAIYNNMLASPPSPLKTGAVTKAALEGPARHALTLAGQRVGEAAAQGPELRLKPIQEAIAEVAEQFRPSELYGDALTTPMTAGAAVARRQAGVAPGERVSIEEYRKLVAGAYDPATRSVKNIAELPGILGMVQRLEGDTIPFEIAHSLKMILQGMVNYDARTKDVMSKITKGAAARLREEMAGFAPYDDATAAFSALVPMYYEGIGGKLFDMARSPDGAAKIAAGLSGDPAEALVVRSLLLDQAAAGGDALAGQRAWDGVRGVFTYNNLLKGGVETLSDRIHALTTQKQDLAAAIYHDVTGQKILTNLDTIGQAVKQITEQGAEQSAVGQTALAAAGRADVRAATAAGTAANKSTAALGKAFEKSSVGTRSSLELKTADLIRGVGLGPRSIWGALSIIRLLGGAKGPDLLRWAAYSDRNTQRVVKALLGPGPDALGAAGVRATQDIEETKLLFRDLAPILADAPGAGAPTPTTSP